MLQEIQEKMRSYLHSEGANIFYKPFVFETPAGFIANIQYEVTNSIDDVANLIIELTKAGVAGFTLQAISPDNLDLLLTAIKHRSITTDISYDCDGSKASYQQTAQSEEGTAFIANPAKLVPLTTACANAKSLLRCRDSELKDQFGAYVLQKPSNDERYLLVNFHGHDPQKTVEFISQVYNRGHILAGTLNIHEQMDIEQLPQTDSLVFTDSTAQCWGYFDGYSALHKRQDAASRKQCRNNTIELRNWSKVYQHTTDNPEIKESPNKHLLLIASALLVGSSLYVQSILGFLLGMTVLGLALYTHANEERIPDRPVAMRNVC